MEGLGLEIAPLDAAVAKQLGMEGTEGVVITSVREKSPGGRGRDWLQESSSGKSIDRK